MEKIISVLRERYQPRALLVYGSYARGDADACSDFDCMLIVDSKPCGHDDSVIDGVVLDCFLFTPEETEAEDLDPFLPIYDSRIVLDDGSGAALKERVRTYVDAHRVLPDQEKEFLASWIRKTLRRAEKDDDEGNFRAVAFLAESLMDYCSLRDLFYFGSKQTAAWLREHDSAGYERFHAAVTRKTPDSIRAWADWILRKEESS